jgi:predicted DNA-binding transcriptional regulator AlpA
MADTLPLTTGVASAGPTDPVEPPRPDAGRPPAPAAAVAPLLLDTRDMCAALRISLATLHRLKAAGRLPKPRNLAGLKWDADEVRRWVRAGMPALKEWENAQRDGRPR